MAFDWTTDKGIWLQVSLFGAGGGVLSQISEIESISSWSLQSIPELLLAAGLGGLAAITFLFVIVNTDRTDWIRLISFAMLCGFFHSIVIEAGKDFLERQSQDEIVADLTNEIRNVRAAVTKDLDSQTSKQRTEELVTLINSRGATVTNPESLARLRTEIKFLSSELVEEEQISAFRTLDGVNNNLKSRTMLGWPGAQSVKVRTLDEPTLGEFFETHKE